MKKCNPRCIYDTLVLQAFFFGGRPGVPTVLLDHVTYPANPSCPVWT